MVSALVAFLPVEVPFVFVTVESCIFHRELEQEILSPVLIHLFYVTTMERMRSTAIFDDVRGPEAVVHVLVRRVELVGL